MSSSSSGTRPPRAGRGHRARHGLDLFWGQPATAGDALLKLGQGVGCPATRRQARSLAGAPVAARPRGGGRARDGAVLWVVRILIASSLRVSASAWRAPRPSRNPERRCARTRAGWFAATTCSVALSASLPPRGTTRALVPVVPAHSDQYPVDAEHLPSSWLNADPFGLHPDPVTDLDHGASFPDGSSVPRGATNRSGDLVTYPDACVAMRPGRALPRPFIVSE